MLWETACKIIEGLIKGGFICNNVYTLVAFLTHTGFQINASNQPRIKSHGSAWPPGSLSFESLGNSCKSAIPNVKITPSNLEDCEIFTLAQPLNTFGKMTSTYSRKFPCCEFTKNC